MEIFKMHVSFYSYYTHFFSNSLYRISVPDTIQNLQMLIEDDTINFNWSVPASEDCRTYQLTLNDESPQNLVENWFRTPYSTTNCTRIELGLIDNDNKTGEITTREGT